MAVHIPAGTQLIVSGPAIVEVTPQVAPTLAPTATPTPVPNLVPTPAPTATPPMHPGMTVAGFQPTYESWGGYSPVPQYHGESHRPAPLLPTYETTEGFSPVAPDQHKGMGPTLTQEQVAAAKEALAAKKPGPERDIVEAHLEVEEAKVKAKEKSATMDGETIVQRLYSALGLHHDDLGPDKNSKEAMMSNG